jgi:hypothetical protein
MAMALHSVACDGAAARSGIIFVVAIFLEKFFASIFLLKFFLLSSVWFSARV